MMKKQLIGLAVALIFVLSGCGNAQQTSSKTNNTQAGDQAVADTVVIPSSKYPETAQHVKEAIQEGETNICTIDRNGASERRKQSLAGIKTAKGKDRDEYPMAMCKEGGKGANVKLIDSSDNRGAGSYVGNKLDKYKDGTKIKIVAE